MTKDDLLDIRAALDKASYWACKQADLFQIIDAKKKVETLLNEIALPSNLNEAAAKYDEEHMMVNGCGVCHNIYDVTVEDAFKAGVEWMAKQGVSYQATISADKTIPVLPMKDVSDMGLDYGDKIRVIIVKEK